MQRWNSAMDALQHEKTWFWWADRQKRAAVSERKQAERAARAVLRKHEKHIEGLLSQAKAELGLFSELGLEEGRRLFWQSFQAGKASLSLTLHPQQVLLHWSQQPSRRSSNVLTWLVKVSAWDCCASHYLASIHGYALGNGEQSRISDEALQLFESQEPAKRNSCPLVSGMAQAFWGHTRVLYMSRSLAGGRPFGTQRCSSSARSRRTAIC